MKRDGSMFLFVLLLVLMSMAGGLSSADEASNGEWICPPCGGNCDKTVFDHPGDCPLCGMRLVKKEDVVQPRRVAILVFDGVQIIDYTGPYEVFGQAHFEVFTVSKDGKPITTAMGMRVTPTYSMENAPEAEVLVIPGGHVQDTYQDEAVLDWLRRRTEQSRQVMSVCNGAFLLAKTGLLDGKRATTFYGLIDELREFAPEVEVVSDQRFVDNGKIITTAGLSSGIDGSLHVIEKLFGHGRAQSIALHLEYDWDPDSHFARAALADRVLPALPRGPDMQVEVARTEGDRDHWNIDWHVTSTELDLAGLDEFLRERLKDEAGWILVAHESGEDRTSTRWRFEDDQKRSWEAATAVVREGEEPAAYTVTLTIDRSGGTTPRAEAGGR